MTVERKIVLGLGDLKALIFECRNHEKDCRVRVTVRPDNASIPARCPGCGVEWVKHPQSELVIVGSIFSNLIETISKIRVNAANNAEWPKFHVLFEFDEPEIAGRKSSPL